MTKGQHPKGPRALLVVDVQNDFCEGGSLAVSGGDAVAVAIAHYLASAPGVRYAHVVATQDHHVRPGTHFSEHPDFIDSWPPHCVAGTPGAWFHPALDGDGEFEEVFRKGQRAAAYSGFEGVSSETAKQPLADWLGDRRVKTIDIAGIATDYCVRATATDAIRLGFTVRVLLNLTAGVAPGTTAAAIADMSAMGVQLIQAKSSNVGPPLP